MNTVAEERFEISDGRKSGIVPNIIYTVTLVAVLLAYYLLYFNRCLPINEGWHLAYAELISDGKVPYRDFFYGMPPLDFVISGIYWRLSFGSLLVYRTWRMAERLLTFVLLFFELKKVVKPFYAWFGCVIGGVFISAMVYDELGDYNYTGILFCVILMITMNKFITGDKKYKSIWMILSGFVMGLMFCLKQTFMVASSCVLLVYLIIYCLREKEFFLKRLAQAFCGLIIPVSIMCVYLIMNNAFIPMIEQVYLNANSKGGSALDIFITPFFNLLKQYNLLSVSFSVIGLIFLSQRKQEGKIYTLLRVLLFSFVTAALLSKFKIEWLSDKTFWLYAFFFVGIFFALYYILKRVSAYENSNFKGLVSMSVVAVLFVLIELFMVYSCYDISYKIYIKTSLFGDLTSMSYILYIINIFMAIYIFRPCFICSNKWRCLTLLGVSFLCAFAHLLSSRDRVAMFEIGLTAAVLIAFALNSKAKRLNILKNVLIITSCFMACTVCMSQKITKAFDWWGTSEEELSEETFPVEIEGLEGFRLSLQHSNMFEQVYKTIESNTDDTSTIMGYPHVTIFNLLNNNNFAGFTPVYFYDVCPDEYAETDAKIFYENPPDIVVYADIPGCLETHEIIFRKGNIAGQRKIMEWLVNALDKYSLICQASNVYVYKLNDNGIDTGYTYYESANTSVPSTLVPIQKGMISSSGDVINYEYSMLKGNGTKYSPYLIESKDDLVLFRDMVNYGLDFNGKYVEQTADIDLSGENWVPIGIYLGDHYFMGTYNGNGHIINNLYINNSYQGEPMNVGFFGILAGTVENLGIINGDVYGDCVGGITSHGSSGTKILNCYYNGKLTGTVRAGGIADNISTENSMISNCYFKGTLEAPVVFGINSYWAEQVINCAYVGNYPCSDESTLITKNNIQFADDTVAICEFLNSNFSQIEDQVFDSYSFNRWTFDESRNVHLSDETLDFTDRIVWIMLIISFFMVFVAIFLLAELIRTKTKHSTKKQRLSNSDE